MSAYSEFLRSQGASAEDIAILDTPVAQHAFDAQQATAVAAIADYKQKADTWYETVAQPNLTKAQQDAAAAQQAATRATAEAARLRSLVAQSTDDSLKQVAKDMGYTLDGSGNPPPEKKDSPIDTSKFVTTDTIAGLADQVGSNLARMQDMVLEHMQLFPGQRLNVAKLREEAVAQKKNVYELWEQKYKVPEARTAAEKATLDARDAAIRKEEREKVTAELASQYANPNTVPAGTSNSPFVPRPKAGREKAPWEAGLDGDNGSGDRVAHAAKSWADRQAGTRTN